LEIEGGHHSRHDTDDLALFQGRDDDLSRRMDLAAEAKGGIATP
jgi:hypothetical protein